MSYRCGIGRGLEALGLEPGPPRITCDACGRVLTIKQGLPPKWLLDNRAPPKWTLFRQDDGTRRDFCPDHTLETLLVERDAARATARILAHSYVNDSRPPDSVVRGALTYPAVPSGVRT